MLQLATFWGRRRMLIRERGRERRHDGKRYGALSSPPPVHTPSLLPSLSLSRGRYGENVRTRGHEEARPPLNCTFAGRKFKYPAALPQPPHLSHVAEKVWVRNRMAAEGFEAGGAEWVLNAVAPCSLRQKIACGVRAPRACMCGRSAICGFAMSMRQITRL